jgi:iron complex transport system ATP-binding protein
MLARAMIGDPQILIADEPVSGLDPRHALDTVGRLQGLAGQGKLVVAALHDLTLAARFCSHILALRDGRLAAFGQTAEILTPGLIQAVFDVDARISGQGQSTYVDFLGVTPAGA